MSLIEWGRSFNALSVPLTSDWQCSLVPARDMDEPASWWSLSYDERQKKCKEREEQIEQDRKDFDRVFRVSISRRAARGCRDFGAYAAFIGEHLCIAGLSAPVDGEGVTRILRGAVRDGRLVPAINRAWRGSRRVGRFYGPQSWPKRAPDPKPTIYSFRNGQLEPLGADGGFIDRMPYVPIGIRSAGGGGFDWQRAVEFVAGALPGSNSDGAPGMADSLASGDDPTLFGDAQPFEYQPDMPGGDSFDIAKTPNEGDPGTWYTNPGSGQMRMYGHDGQPLVDFDFDHDHGQGIPHAHNWDNGVRGPGVSFSQI